MDFDATVTFNLEDGGEVVGPYRLRRVLGAGGMGVVMLAWDTRLEREVALKFLATQTGGRAEAQERFVREARAAARLNHPNIVTVYETGEAAGRVYIAMEYVRGRVLRQIIDTESIGAERALEICRCLCAGLEQAHRHGVIHRDIKPANVIVTEQSCPKLVDFGLAAMEAADHVTRSGTVLGTVNYMSPEQAQGQSLDFRSDIFSLGIVLYEMLTGVCPFERGFTAATLHAIVHDPAPPLAERGLTGQPDCQSILDKALAKDPAKRYQSAADFGRDLDTILAGRPVEKPSRVEEVSGRRERTLAVLYFRNNGAADDEHLHHALTEEITVDIVKRVPLRVVPIRKVAQYRSSTLQPEEIARRLGATVFLDGSLAREADCLRITVELFDLEQDKTLFAERWAEPIKNVNRIIEGIVGKVREAVGSAGPAERECSAKMSSELSNPAAYEFYLRGKYAFDRKAGPADVEAAAGMFRKALEMDPSLLRARAGVARVLIHQAQNEKAERYLHESLDEARRRGSVAEESEFSKLLGAVLNRSGRYLDAVGHLKRAVELAQAAGDAGLEVEANSMLLSAYCRLNDYREGEAVFERTMEISHQLDDQVPMIHAKRYMGWLYLQHGHRIRARQMFQSALQIARQARDAEAEAYVYNDIGMCHQASVGYGLAAARDYLEKARTALEHLEDRGNVATVMGNLGIVYQNMGDFETALEYSEAAAQRKKELGDLATFALYSANASSSLISLGRYQEAYRRAEAAAETARQRSYTVARVWANSVGGFAVFFAGDPRRAESMLRDSLAQAIEADLAQQVSDAYSMLGRICFHDSRFEEARGNFERGIEAARKFGHEHALIYCAAYIAAIEGRQGNWGENAQRLERLRHRAEGTYLEPSLLRLKGEVLLSSGNPEERAEGLQALRAARGLAGSMHFAPELAWIETLLAGRE